MNPFREATYEQLQRVVNIIDKYKPVEMPGTQIPAIGFLERWVDDMPNEDDIAGQMGNYGKIRSTEETIQMWERARPRE
jgi:hypothetical protein